MENVKGGKNTCSTWANKLVTSAQLLHHPSAAPARTLFHAICFATLPDPDDAPALFCSSLLKKKIEIKALMRQQRDDISEHYSSIEQSFFEMIHELVIQMLSLAKQTSALSEQGDSKNSYHRNIINRLERMLSDLSSGMAYLDYIEIYEQINSIPLLDHSGGKDLEFSNLLNDCQSLVDWFFPFFYRYLCTCNMR